MLHRAIAPLTVALAILIAWGLGAAQHPTAEPPAAQPTRPTQLGWAGGQMPPQLTWTVPASAGTTRSLVDRRAAPPRRIQISAIGISARVIPLGLHPDGTLQTPRKWAETGWYKPGPEPGERGAAVIVGHVDSKTGPAVFYRLRALRRGALIRIRRADNSSVRFRVQRVERWPKADFPTSRVYGPTRGSVLRLVTCAGNFNRSTGHYEDNTIVYANRV
jgi:hypothetical protein